VAGLLVPSGKLYRELYRALVLKWPEIDEVLGKVGGKAHATDPIDLDQGEAGLGDGTSDQMNPLTALKQPLLPRTYQTCARTVSAALLLALLAPLSHFASDNAAERAAVPATPAIKRPPVAAIYFPGYHQDPHYDSWFGEGWNEWQLLEQAPQRFPGQRFFRSEWGHFDEASPVWMERQIDLAADHGIDVFIFDWYWYSGVKILYRPLEEGFLKANNRNRLRYALMWANHDWKNYFPAALDRDPTLWLPSRATPHDFEQLMGHCITTHFVQSNYWRVDGGVYFGIFDAAGFLRQLGGPEKTREVVAQARKQVAAAGLGRLHLAAFAFGLDQIPQLKTAGFDSLTTYNITASGRATLPGHPLDDYADLARRHESFWKEMDTGLLPYAPVVTIGWDPSPRWDKSCPWPPPNRGYPYTTIVTNNSPEQFGELCRKALGQCQSSRLPTPAIVVNAWNEWTEGSALLPDQTHKSAFLEELQKALLTEAP
jgi:hypothetical protein